jgi:parvulin-like peptidyl-prolyl isomerase
MQIARIDDEILDADDFVKTLRLDNRFNTLIEPILLDKLTVRAAKQSGITVTPTEIQERVDQFRRVEGLHRAQDTFAFLEALGVTLDEFETHMTEILYREKMLAHITRQEAIKEYFRLHSPKFDSIELNHITVDSEGKARELLALLEDEPTLFPELAREHSLDLESKLKGGYIGKVLRGALPNDVEAKLFNAPVGALLGPFASDDELIFEIFQIKAKHPARLDEATTRDVARMIRGDWLAARAQEHRLEVL